MESRKKKVLKGTLIAGALLGASTLVAAPATMFNYNDLGSGSDVRTTLLERSQSNSSNLYLELKCGEGKCGEEGKESKETKKTETKTKEGEAKAVTTTKSKTKKTKESKTEEGKCGEGKCGEGSVA